MWLTAESIPVPLLLGPLPAKSRVSQCASRAPEGSVGHIVSPREACLAVDTKKAQSPTTDFTRESSHSSRTDGRPARAMTSSVTA